MATLDIQGKSINIERVRNDWALALMTKGIIVKLSISKWNGNSPLKYSALGIKFKDDETFASIKKYICLGYEKLLPPELIAQISTIEARARATLSANSFDTIWGKFVPFTAFSQWQNENILIKEDFEFATKKFIERYDEIIFIIRKEYRNIAIDSWHRLYPGTTGSAPESFIEDYISRVISKIPNKLDMERSFSYTTTFFQIPLPSFIEDDLKKRELVQQEREQQQVNHQLEIEARRRISEEYIKKKQEYIDVFLDSTVNNMRVYVAELCDGILDSIYKNDKNSNDITKRQRDKIKALIKKINLLNFYNDPEVSNMANELDIEVSKFKGERNKDIVTEKLQKLIDIKNIDFVPTNYNPIISSLEL
jgi:hypothetical protein